MHGAVDRIRIPFSFKDPELLDLGLNIPCHYFKMDDPLQPRCWGASNSIFMKYVRESLLKHSLGFLTRLRGRQGVRAWDTKRAVENSKAQGRSCIWGLPRGVSICISRDWSSTLGEYPTLPNSGVTSVSAPPELASFTS